MQAKTSPSVDYADITKNQQTTWSTGDFNEVARQNVSMAEALCKAADPRPGQRVLDVACGSGSVALVAARRYCEVTGIDYVPELIERAELRASAAGLDADFRVGDAQNLPFPDDSFDVVCSVFGVQFAPDQQQAANELLRVCRSGGTIGLATPVPMGWTGDYFSVQSQYVPPPPGVKPASRWGTKEGLDELLGDGVRSMANESRTNLAYFRSVDHAVEVFSTYFGPTVKALEASDGNEREQLQEDIRSVFRRHNRATDGTAVIEAQYLQTIAICA